MPLFSFIFPCVHQHEHPLGECIDAQPVASEADEGVQADFPCYRKPFTEEINRRHSVAILEELSPLRIHRHGVEHFPYIAYQPVRFYTYRPQFISDGVHYHFPFFRLHQYACRTFAVKILCELLYREAIPYSQVALSVPFLETAVVARRAVAQVVEESTQIGIAVYALMVILAFLLVIYGERAVMITVVLVAEKHVGELPADKGLLGLNIAG